MHINDVSRTVYASTATNLATVLMNVYKRQPLMPVIIMVATRLLWPEEHLNSAMAYLHLAAMHPEADSLVLIYIMAFPAYQIWDMETLAITTVIHPHPAVAVMMDKKEAICVWYKVETI